MGDRGRKEKTRTERSGMLSTRLRHLLEMRQLDPAGEPWPGEAYVFGDELGPGAGPGDDSGALDRPGREGRSRGATAARHAPRRRQSIRRNRDPISTCRSCSATPTSPPRRAICATSGAAWPSSRSTDSIKPGPRPRRRGRGPRSSRRPTAPALTIRPDRAHTEDDPTGLQRRCGRPPATGNRDRSLDGNTTNATPRPSRGEGKFL